MAPLLHVIFFVVVSLELRLLEYHIHVLGCILQPFLLCLVLKNPVFKVVLRCN